MHNTSKERLSIRDVVYECCNGTMPVARKTALFIGFSPVNQAVQFKPIRTEDLNIGNSCQSYRTGYFTAGKQWESY